MTDILEGRNNAIVIYCASEILRYDSNCFFVRQAKRHTIKSNGRSKILTKELLISNNKEYFIYRETLHVLYYIKDDKF